MHKNNPKKTNNTSPIKKGALVKVKNRGIKGYFQRNWAEQENTVSVWLEPDQILLVLDKEKMCIMQDTYCECAKFLFGTQILIVYSCGVTDKLAKYFIEAK